MNPELPSPQFTPEQGPTHIEQGSEYGQVLQNPEKAGERSPEREQNMQAIDRSGALAPPLVMPMPTVPQPVVPQPVPQAPADDANPVMAGDDDLIEKEWVDKAKKIIIETKEDPYRREREVNRLQVDYLRKRYGKELGVSE
jgi:hypothetical protein